MPSITQDRVRELQAIAARVRGHVLMAVHHAQGGHIGGPLSCADMLVALYFHVLSIDPANPDWEDRDRFVLSKGHSAVGLYAVLAERGFFPVEELLSFDEINSRLQGHPDMTKTPGVDMSTGSLGQGLSPGIGMALGARMLEKPFHTYVMLGDGESQEGQIWEAAFIAARYELDNLTVILDYNGLQQYGWHGEGGILRPIDNPKEKWKAFGWNTLEADGHDMPGFVSVLEEAREAKGKPTIVVANTRKGKGVTFIENRYEWHAKVPTDEELELALAELGQTDLRRKPV